MNKKLIAIPLLLFSLLCFADDETESNKIDKDNFPESFFYQQPRLNFFKPNSFNPKDAQFIGLYFNKYALHDLGINEQQFKTHIDHFLKYTYEFLEDRDVDGPLLISFALEATKPKEDNISCSKTPKKCAINKIEIVLNNEYDKLSEPLSKYVIKKLDEEGDSATNISEDYSEPIISNFDYIGEMRAAILVNLTKKEKMNSNKEKLLNTIKKSLPSLIYPDGENNAKKYSSLQKQYFEINSKNENNPVEKNETTNDDISTKSLNKNKPNNETDKNNEEANILMEFNQLKQKMFPIITSKQSKNI